MIGWGHMTEAYFPVSGLPLSERMRCHRIPTRCIPCQRVNSSTCQLTVYLSGQPANWSMGQLVASLRQEAPRGFEILRGIDGDGMIIGNDGLEGKSVGEETELLEGFDGLKFGRL